MTIDAADHIGLVYFVMKKLAPHDDEDEAFSAGLYGLTKAARDFEPDRGLKFSTMATKYIYIAMQHEWRTRRAKCRDIGRKVSMDALSHNSVGRRAEPSRFEVLDAEQDARLRVHEILGHMPEMYQDILLRRAAGQTLEEIGKDYGMSREAARGYERRAFAEAKRIAKVDTPWENLHDAKRANNERRRRMGMSMDKSRDVRQMAVH